MTELSFQVLDILAEPYAAAPQLTARLRITESTGAVVHAIALRCQVRIEPQRRPYDEAEERALLGMFGPRARWRDTLRPFQWMQCGAMVQGFSSETEIDLALPCSYDFEVTGSAYLHALQEGSVPLNLLFSGTIFTRGSKGFGVEQVPWDREAGYPLPVKVWRELIELNYPHTGYLRVDRDLVDALAQYKADRGLTTWDAVIESLLAASREGVS